MKATKILNSDIADIKISALPTRPTAPKSLGGKGYGAKEMKEAFDRLPLFIIKRYNDLIDDIASIGDDSLSGSIPTGIKDSHTLSQLFRDVTSGEFASYCMVLGESLATHLIEMRAEIDSLKARLGTEGEEA